MTLDLGMFCKGREAVPTAVGVGSRHSHTAQSAVISMRSLTLITGKVPDSETEVLGVGKGVPSNSMPYEYGSGSGCLFISTLEFTLQSALTLAINFKQIYPFKILNRPPLSATFS